MSNASAGSHPLTALAANPVIRAQCDSRCGTWSVFVKYRGEVDLAPFACQDVTRSSLVFRVCYDAPNQYLLISLKGTYYHYCRIDPAMVDGLLGADSMGRFYNARIKGRFDCRQGGVPNY